MGRCAWLVAWVMAGAGCATTVQSSGDDASVADASAADAAFVDAVSDTAVEAAFRCDPPIIADAGVPSISDSGAYVVEMAMKELLNQCARMSDGTVRCRGSNLSGEIGDGTQESRLDPVTVPGLSGVAQIVSAFGAYCTRHTDGTVRCWGYNHYDGVGTGRVGDEQCFLGRRCRTRPTQLPELSDVVRLTSSGFTMCAVRRDGTVWCWGDSRGPGFPGGGESTTRPTRNPNVSDVVDLRGTGFGWWVEYRDGTTAWMGRFISALPPNTRFDDAMSRGAICARLPDTSVRCTGSNYFGKRGDGTSHELGEDTLSNPGLCGVRSIVAGDYHTCAVMFDRTLWCWGDDSFGGLGYAATDTCVGLNDDRTCSSRPRRVPGIDQAEQVFVGTWSTCVTRTDHSLWCWGSIVYGDDRMTPRRMEW